MSSKLSTESFTVGDDSMLPESLGDSRQLLSTLFKSSTVGVAICDRQLRFRAVNEAFASIHGIPAAAHIGKRIRAVLGRAARKIQAAMQRVLRTGEAITNVEITAELPSTRRVARWSANYFPIDDRAKSVRWVGAIVLELPVRKELSEPLDAVVRKLSIIRSALRSDAARLTGSNASVGGLGDMFVQSLDLLDESFLELCAISGLLGSDEEFIGMEGTRGSSPASRAALPDVSPLMHVFAGPVHDPVELINPLSNRELEVISALAAGKNNKEIAASLGISARTVETHRAKIMLKLHLHSFSELMRYAFRNRLARP